MCFKKKKEHKKKIYYKNLDNNPTIENNIKTMEKKLLGEKGVGLMTALEITPSKLMKFLDNKEEKEK